MLFRQFVGISLFQIKEDLVDNRASTYYKHNQECDKSISDNDQSVLFYISGYIVQAMKMLHKRIKSVKLVTESTDKMIRKESESRERH